MDELRLVIAGELRSGKSTLANYAEEHYHMAPFAFGDELKSAFHYFYPHIPRDPKPRKGYQLFGQFMRYVYGEDYWLKQCFENIETSRKAAAGYGFSHDFAPIITDARQPNEFEYCREQGYKIIKVVAPLEARKERALKEGDVFNEEDLQHETELYVKTLTPDYLIINDGTLQELCAQFDRVVENIRYGGPTC